MRIERLDPDTFNPGKTVEVTVIGRGFDTATCINFLDPDPTVEEGTLNPDLAVLAVLFVSSETLRLRSRRRDRPSPDQRPHRLWKVRRMITTLRSRKENAYAVAPRAPQSLEDRLVHLQASPQAVAWDLYGNRLLYHRADWHYRVLLGTAPEEIVDYGRVDNVICALPAAARPLTDVAQGEIVALLASDEITEDPGYAGLRVVEVIAADPVQGQFAVYSHREDVESPYVTLLSGFDAGGGPISAASFPQPPDDTPRWHVPHAVLHDDILYAIERDSTA